MITSIAGTNVEDTISQTIPVTETFVVRIVSGVVEDSLGNVKIISFNPVDDIVPEISKAIGSLKFNNNKSKTASFNDEFLFFIR